MAQKAICPRGHIWDPSVLDGLPPSAMPRCPICGEEESLRTSRRIAQLVSWSRNNPLLAGLSLLGLVLLFAVSAAIFLARRQIQANRLEIEKAQSEMRQAGADDRYFYHDGQARAGQLQTQQELTDADRIGLVDEWRGLNVSLALSRRGFLRAFPIQTVSQSEGGFELVHQSTVVMPQWSVEADERGRWETTLTLKLDVAQALARLRRAA
jgi:hypothetical protein